MSSGVMIYPDTQMLLFWWYIHKLDVHDNYCYLGHKLTKVCPERKFINNYVTLYKLNSRNFVYKDTLDHRIPWRENIPILRVRKLRHKYKY